MNPSKPFTPNVFKGTPSDPKPIKLDKPKKKYVYKKKATGLVPLMERIWKERKHISFITGENLGNDAMPEMFLHVLPKGLNKYPHFKLYEKNIVLGTYEDHVWWDHKRSECRKNPKFDKMFKLEAELLLEYKRLHGKK